MVSTNIVLTETVRDRSQRSVGDQVALITGASRGIGAATALVLAKRGFRVVVNHLASAQEGEAVVAAIREAGGEAVAIRADVTAPGDVAAMFDETNQRWGRVDVLVHNALIPFDVTSFADLSWEQLGGKLDRELRAAFLITKAVVPGMISRHYGRLVYLSSGLSRRPRDGMIALGTAKAALDQFVRFIALELAPHGITANLVAPATVAGETRFAVIPCGASSSAIGTSWSSAAFAVPRLIMPLRGRRDSPVLIYTSRP